MNSNKPVVSTLLGVIVGILLCFAVFFGCLAVSLSIPTPTPTKSVSSQVNATMSAIPVNPATETPTDGVSLHDGMTLVAGHMTQTAEYVPQPVLTTVQPQPTAGFTRAQLNAIKSAQSYIRYSSFSRSGLIHQLEFEKYTPDDATFAVDYLQVDWTEQAYLSAKSYLRYSSFSLPELIGQLEFEGFTAEQAASGATRAYSE